MHSWLYSPRVQVKMRRPICSFVGLGGGVKVGNGVGKVLSGMFRFEILIGLEGIKMHKAIAAATKSKPIGRRTLRVRGWFRREKMRRLDIGFINFTSDY